jgi:hypothetical protein
MTGFDPKQTFTRPALGPVFILTLSFAMEFGQKGYLYTSYTQEKRVQSAICSDYGNRGRFHQNV